MGGSDGEKEEGTRKESDKWRCFSWKDAEDWTKGCQPGRRWGRVEKERYQLRGWGKWTRMMIMEGLGPRVGRIRRVGCSGVGW